ncbi:MAG TPA: hypothetical protein VFY39_12910 [Gammaproteobacteria bacterium]|nr:hypothetical protein [Gammaproteobacteria bacterium]
MRWVSIRRAAALGALAALAFSSSERPAAAADRVPDISGVWKVKFEKTPSGQALIDELPKGTVLINDAGGGELAAHDYAGLKLTERALDQIRHYDYKAELLRANTCVTPSVAFYMQAPFPMRIHQGRDLIVLQMEYFDMFRVIHLDTTQHAPPDAPHTKSGDSIGHWEGNTLVVDTTNIEAGTFMNNGFDHSEHLHLVEHFRLSPDGKTLWLTQLYEDPETFQGKAARYMAWTRDPDGVIYPYECDPSYGR